MKKLFKNKSYQKMIREIKEITKNKREILIAIDGMSGSGKTTLSYILKEEFDANVFHIDDFFKKPSVDKNDLLSTYGSNIDFDLIKTTIINPIKTKKSIVYKPFDFKTHSHLQEITVPYKRINIIEGSFSLHPYLINNYNYKIFLKVNKFKQLIRIYKRSGFKRLKDFIKKWIPNEKKYHDDLKIESESNIVIIS